MALDQHSFTPATFNRRSLLTVAPAASFSALVATATPVAAAAETPVSTMFREWVAADAASNAAYEADDSDEGDRLGRLRHQIELKIMKLPSQTAHDVLIKVVAWTNFGMFTIGEEFDERVGNVWEEARAFID